MPTWRSGAGCSSSSRSVKRSLSTGAQLSEQPQWSAPILIGAAVAFGAVIAAWWIYFGTSSADGVRPHQ